MIVVVSFIDQFAQIDAQHKIAPIGHFTTPLQQINAARQIAAIQAKIVILLLHVRKKIIILLLVHT